MEHGGVRIEPRSHSRAHTLHLRFPLGGTVSATAKSLFSRLSARGVPPNHVFGLTQDVCSSGRDGGGCYLVFGQPKAGAARLGQGGAGRDGLSKAHNSPPLYTLFFPRKYSLRSIPLRRQFLQDGAREFPSNREAGHISGVSRKQALGER